MKKQIMALVLLGTMLLGGCGSNASGTVNESSNNASNTGSLSEFDSEANVENSITLSLELVTGDKIDTTICSFPEEWDIEYDTTAIKQDESGGNVSVGYRYTPYNNVSEESAEILDDIKGFDNPVYNSFTIQTATGEASVIVYPSNGGDEHSFIDIIQPLPDNYKGVLTISVCEWPSEDGKGAHTWKELSAWTAEEVSAYVAPFLYTGKDATATENEGALPLRVTNVANYPPEYEDPGLGTLSINEELSIHYDSEYSLTLLDGVEDSFYPLYLSSSKSVGVFEGDEICDTYNETLKELVNKTAANNSKNGDYQVYTSDDGNSFVAVYTNPTDQYDANYVYVHAYRQLGWIDYVAFPGEASEKAHHEMVYRDSLAIIDKEDAEEVTELIQDFHDYLGIDIELQ